MGYVDGMTTESLLDLLEAMKLADEAIKQSYDHAPDEWKLKAENTVRSLAHTRKQFTTDDVWEKLAEAGFAVPPEPRALGGVIRQIAKEGLIFATNAYAKSLRPVCHTRPIRIWESRVFANANIIG